jgi:hypothetical protein
MDSMGALYGPDPTCIFASSNTGRRLLQDEVSEDDAAAFDAAIVPEPETVGASATAGLSDPAGGDIAVETAAASPVDVCAGFSAATRVADGYNPWDLSHEVGMYFCTTAKLTDNKVSTRVRMCHPSIFSCTLIKADYDVYLHNIIHRFMHHYCAAMY